MCRPWRGAYPPVATWGAAVVAEVRGARVRGWGVWGMCRPWRGVYPPLVTWVAQKEDVVSTEENKAVSRRVAEEIFNGGNLDLADELYASDYVLHNRSLPEDLIGPEGIKQYVAMNLGAFPDGRVPVGS